MTDSSHPARPRRSVVRPGFDPVAQPWTVANANLKALPSHALTPAALLARLTRPGGWPTELPRDTGLRYPGREGEPVKAAVLIPLVVGPDELRVLFTQRAAHLHDHAGQISFPGGRIEHTDVSALAAALRETEEEIGLPASYAQVLGNMPDYPTTTGFTITPFVALIRPGFVLAPDTSVADIFEVPLAFLMDPANHRLYEARLPDGHVRRYYAMLWKQHFIWGATAGMLRNLYHVLAGTPVSCGVSISCL